MAVQNIINTVKLGCDFLPGVITNIILDYYLNYTFGKAMVSMKIGRITYKQEIGEYRRIREGGHGDYQCFYAGHSIEVQQFHRDEMKFKSLGTFYGDDGQYLNGCLIVDRNRDQCRIYNINSPDFAKNCQRIVAVAGSQILSLTENECTFAIDENFAFGYDEYTDIFFAVKAIFISGADFFNLEYEYKIFNDGGVPYDETYVNTSPKNCFKIWPFVFDRKNYKLTKLFGNESGH